MSQVHCTSHGLCPDMLLHVQVSLQLIPLLQSFVISVQNQSVSAMCQFNDMWVHRTTIHANSMWRCNNEINMCFGDEMLSRTHVHDWSKSFNEGWPEVESMQRLCLLQGKLWPVSFGTLKVSYSWIFWYNNETSVQLIIWSFLKTK
jgi:hypothetical protein